MNHSFESFNSCNETHNGHALLLNSVCKLVDVDGLFVLSVMGLGSPWVEASVLVLVLVSGSFSFHLSLGVSGVTLMAPWVARVLSVEVVVLGVSLSTFSNGTVVSVRVTSPRVVGLDLLLGVTSPLVLLVLGLLMLVLSPRVLVLLLLGFLLLGLLVLMLSPWVLMLLVLVLLRLAI